MKRILLALAILIASSASATTRYVAATAGTFTGGTACNGQTAITPATWNATAESAGDISYVCGAIGTSSDTNITYLTFGWSGANGNPIQLIFDTGASMKPAYCNGSNGCITSNGNNYILINGGTNGIIQNQFNGTSGGACPGGTCTNQAASIGIFLISCTGCTVENLIIADIYDRSSNSDASTGEQNSTGLNIRMNQSGATNFSALNNTIHDANKALFYGFGTSDSGCLIQGNNLYNANWTIGMGSFSGSGQNLTGCIINNNTFHDLANWDDYPSPYNNHHNFFFAYNNSGETLTGLIVSNNYGYGDFGNGTGPLHTENNSGTAALSVTYFNNYINITASGSTGGNGCISVEGGGGSATTLNVYNNTCVAFTSTGMTGFWLEEPSTTTDIRNNIISTWSTLWYKAPSGTIPTTQNFNDWYAPVIGGNGIWDNAGTDYSTLSSWQTASGLDANSVLANPLLTSGIPSGSSPAAGLGTNLASLCTGNLVTLCQDKNGNARPSSGAWTAGAFNAASGSVSFSPTTVAFGNVPNGYVRTLTTTLSNTTGSTITYSSLTPAGSTDFSETSTCGSFSGGTLANGSNCVLTITYIPTAAPNAAETATLTLAYTGAAGSPLIANLTGTSAGVAAVAQLGPATGKLRLRSQRGTQPAPPPSSLTVFVTP